MYIGTQIYFYCIFFCECRICAICLQVNAVLSAIQICRYYFKQLLLLFCYCYCYWWALAAVIAFRLAATLTASKFYKPLTPRTVNKNFTLYTKKNTKKKITLRNKNKATVNVKSNDKLGTQPKIPKITKRERHKAWQQKCSVNATWRAASGQRATSTQIILDAAAFQHFCGFCGVLIKFTSIYLPKCSECNATLTHVGRLPSCHVARSASHWATEVATEQADGVGWRCCRVG